MRSRDSHSLLALCVTLSLAFASSAARLHAQGAPSSELSVLIRQLGAEDRDAVQQAITALGSRPEPQALRALRALRDGEIRVDAQGQVFLSSGGALLDPVSGARVQADASSLKTPVVSNTLRRVLGPALAEIELRSDDVAVRLEAANEMAKAADERMEPALRAAFERERDAGVRAVLEQTLSEIDFTSTDPKRRLSAIVRMAETADPAFKARLEPLVEQGSDGSYRESDAQVRKAAADALAAIARKELLTRIVRDLFYGLSLGSVLLLAALGLAITFGLMGVINMAHGEMLMLGAYSTYVAQTLMQRYAPNALDWYIVLAVPLAFMMCFLVGVILERTVIRFLYGRPLETLLATWGISLMLIQTVRVIFGAQNVSVANPSWLSGGVEVLSGAVLPYNRIATIGFVIAVVAFVAFLLNRTSLGLQVRAITQNRSMAACMGIATSRVDTLTFGLGSAIAGLGGVALSQIGNVGPELGQLYIVDSFMVVVVGGVGRIAGSVVAAVGLGTVNKVLEPFSGAVLGKILVLVFVVLFIQRRPQGMFAPKGRAVEG